MFLCHGVHLDRIELGPEPNARLERETGLEPNAVVRGRVRAQDRGVGAAPWTLFRARPERPETRTTRRA